MPGNPQFVGGVVSQWLELFKLELILRKCFLLIFVRISAVFFFGGGEAVKKNNKTTGTQTNEASRMNQNSPCPQGAFASLQQLVHKNLAAAISRCEFLNRCFFFVGESNLPGAMLKFLLLGVKKEWGCANQLFVAKPWSSFLHCKGHGFEDQFPRSAYLVLGLCLSGHSGTSPKDRCGSDTSDGAASTTGAFAHHYRPGDMGISIDLVPPQDMQSLLFLEDVPRAHWNPQGERSRLCLKSCLREMSNHSYETHIVCVNCNDQGRQVPKITSKGIMPKHLKV